MDRYQSNRSFSRPYQSTCGRNTDAGPRQARRMERGNENRVQRAEASREEERMREGSCCRLPDPDSGSRADMDAQDTFLENLPLAMAYVPMQRRIRNLYELNDALRLGTIFPELCKPFCGCGKRGGNR